MYCEKRHIKRVLVFGAGGKLGTAVCKAMQNSYQLEGKTRRDLDITDANHVARCIEEYVPDIVINTVAFVGIDACEKDPQMAFATNTHFPKFLAELSNKNDYLLVHISTDAVFDGTKQDFYTETDCPKPVNVYGMTKYGGDCCIQAIAQKYFIFRIPLLFGENPKNNQFIEKMLIRIKLGAKELHISNDIVTSPSYSHDIAHAIKNIAESDTPHGLYHLANEGHASLHDLIKALVRRIGMDIDIIGCSHYSFPTQGLKNTFTPIRSIHLKPLRRWQEALSDYCSAIGDEVNHE